MAVDRMTPTQANHGPTIGEAEYAIEVNEEVAALWAHSVGYLTQNSGTNIIIATCSPTLDAYHQGAAFWWVCTTTTTSATVTLNVNGLGAKSVLLKEGGSPQIGDFQINALYLLVYDGTAFRVVSQRLDAELAAIAALAVTDSNFIVGNGSAWVAETGNTARTSLGLGTGDSPAFTGLSIDNAGGQTSLSIGAAGGGNSGIEIGRIDGTSSSSFIDFHCSTVAVDYNVRVLVSGAAAGVGAGALSITAGTFTWGGSSVLVATDIGSTVQGLDADLTAIAALSTQAYGRGLLVYASEAAFKAGVNLESGVDFQAFDAQLSSLIRPNSQSGAYTTVLTDGGKFILHPAADNNPRTFTIAANGSVAYPIGTAITFINEINTVTIAITTDTMVLASAGTTGSRTLAANGIATAVKITSTKWIISGSGLT